MWTCKSARPTKSHNFKANFTSILCNPVKSKFV
jgi:hypothetical protein